MNRQAALAVVFVVVTMTFPIFSYADSDGYFCASKTYLAYELRQGITPCVTGDVLKLVRLERERGIQMGGDVTLPDFQVHTLTSGEDSIEIGGHGTVRTGDPPLTNCVIKIASVRKDVPDSAQCGEDPTQKHDWRTEGPEPQNLGRWGRPGSIPQTRPTPTTGTTLCLQPQVHRLENAVGRYITKPTCSKPIHARTSRSG
jgi:hypothetical protein